MLNDKASSQKVLGGADVRDLCRPVTPLHTKPRKPFSFFFLNRSDFVHRTLSRRNRKGMLKQERAFPKLLPQSWEYTIVFKHLYAVSIKISLNWNWKDKLTQKYTNKLLSKLKATHHSTRDVAPVSYKGTGMAASGSRSRTLDITKPYLHHQIHVAATMLPMVWK